MNLEQIEIQWNALTAEGMTGLTFDQFKATTMDVLPPGEPTGNNTRPKEQ